MEETIDIFKLNGEISLIKKTINYYQIIFSTKKSYYYCINECGSGQCYCKDKDWSQGTWDGLLLKNCNDQQLAIDIFNYLKNNFNIINNINRPALLLWLKSNLDSFMNIYYLDDLNILKIFVKYLYFIGIFNIYFNKRIRRLFYDKYKNILELNISISDEYTEINSGNNSTILIDNNIYDSSIDTLKKKSLQSINNTLYLYNTYIPEIHFNSDNNIDLNSININELNRYIDSFLMYNDLPIFPNNIFDIKSIEMFLKKYKLEDKYKSILLNGLSNDLLQNYFNKCSFWNDMCEQIERYL